MLSVSCPLLSGSTRVLRQPLSGSGHLSASAAHLATSSANATVFDLLSEVHHGRWYAIVLPKPMRRNNDVLPHLVAPRLRGARMA
jgi:hypothetical protein